MAKKSFSQMVTDGTNKLLKQELIKRGLDPKLVDRKLVRFNDFGGLEFLSPKQKKPPVTPKD